MAWDLLQVFLASFSVASAAIIRHDSSTVSSNGEATHAHTYIHTNRSTDQWLAAHNQVRCQYCAVDVTWDRALETQAQQHIDTSGFQHSTGLVHTGENLYMASSATMGTPQAITASWAAEQANCAWANGFCPFSSQAPVTGHFTVLVSRDVRRIGCATTTTHGGIIGICQYGYHAGGQMHDARQCSSSETSSCTPSPSPSPSLSPSSAPSPSPPSPHPSPSPHPHPHPHTHTPTPTPHPSPGPQASDCYICDKRSPKLVENGVTCDVRIQTWIESVRPGRTTGHALLCNSNPTWRQNKYCITACNTITGEGYEGYEDAANCC